MAKSRRKSGGCTRGRYKRKKMNKGWAADRRQPQPSSTKKSATGGGSSSGS